MKLHKSNAALPASLMILSFIFAVWTPHLVSLLVFALSTALTAFILHMERDKDDRIEGLRSEVKELRERVNTIAAAGMLR